MADYDLAVIGGGINGAAIARDAAGRGLRVALIEQNDLASATSSASTKLIHGGLRYLETGKLRLVRESLQERSLLLKLAPHIVTPLDFVLPHADTGRPRFIVRIGLALYDLLAGRTQLPSSRAIRLDTPELNPRLRHGFRYSDARVDDSRLVILNAVAAAELGADVLTRTRCSALAVDAGSWHLDLAAGNDRRHITARGVVNATGPWATELLTAANIQGARHRLRLVKGSHIVVRRLYEADHAFLFQNLDGRVVFTIPYTRDFTLIGTTEVDYEGDLAQLAATPDEVEYLCSAVSLYMLTPVKPDQVVWSYAGVRPLLDDGANAGTRVTREYKLDLDTAAGAPMLTVFGGKITTYRHLAEECMTLLAPHLGVSADWTHTVPLPGGDVPDGDVDAYVLSCHTTWPWLPLPLLRRFISAYGTRIRALIGECTTVADLGRRFANGLYERELCYLRDVEWARGSEDVLWRCTRLGLEASAMEQQEIEHWFITHPPSA